MNYLLSLYYKTYTKKVWEGFPTPLHPWRGSYPSVSHVLGSSCSGWLLSSWQLS